MEKKLHHLLYTLVLVFFVPATQGAEEKKDAPLGVKTQVKTKSPSSSLAALNSLFQKVDDYESPKIKKFFLENYVKEQANIPSLLREILKSNYFGSPKKILYLYWLIDSIATIKGAFDSESVKIITAIYEKMISATLQNDDTNIKGELVIAFYTYAIPMVTAPKNKKAFQSYKPYTKLLKKYTQKILEDNTLKETISLVTKGEIIPPLAQYVIHDKKYQYVLAQQLDRKMERVGNQLGFPYLCELFSGFSYFAPTKLELQNADLKAQQALATYCKLVKENYIMVYQVYHEIEEKPLYFDVHYANHAFVTLCKNFTHFLQEKKALFHHFCELIPKMDMISKSECCDLLFFTPSQKLNGKSTSYHQLFLAQQIKEVVLLNQKISLEHLGEFLLEPKVLGEIFRVTWPCLIKAYQEELVQQGLPITLKVTNKGNLIIKPSSHNIQLKELTSALQREVEALSFERHLKIIQFQIGKNFSAKKLKKTFQAAEECMIKAPSLQRFDLFLVGFLRENARSFPKILLPIIESYCLNSHAYKAHMELKYRLYKWMEKLTYFYQKGPEKVSKIALELIIDFKCNILSFYIPSTEIPHSLWRMGAEVLSHAGQGKKGTALQKVVFHSFSKKNPKTSFVEPVSSHFFIKLPRNKEDEKKIIPPFYEAWWSYYRQRNTNNFKDLVVPVELFRAFKPLLNTQKRYQEKVCIALDKLLHEANAPKYAFLYGDEVFNSLKDCYIKKYSNTFLFKALNVFKNEDIDKEYKYNLFQRLKTFKFNLKAFCDFVLDLISCETDHVNFFGYSLLGQRLILENCADDLVELFQEDKTMCEDFLTEFEIQKEKISKTPFASTLLTFQQQVQQVQQATQLG